MVESKSQHTRGGRGLLIMAWARARAHELGQACGIRWDVGSVKGETVGDVSEVSRASMAAESTHCAFRPRDAATLEGAPSPNRR